MQAQAEVELAKVRAEAEEKRRSDEIHIAELQGGDKKKAVELQAQKEKRVDESHIKVQIAQIEAAKEQAKIESDKELALKEMELKAQHDQASTSPAAAPPLLIKMPSLQSYHPL